MVAPSFSRIEKQILSATNDAKYRVFWWGLLNFLFFGVSTYILVHVFMLMRNDEPYATYNTEESNAVDVLGREHLSDTATKVPLNPQKKIYGDDLSDKDIWSFRPLEVVYVSVWFFYALYVVGALVLGNKATKLFKKYLPFYPGHVQHAGTKRRSAFNLLVTSFTGYRVGVFALEILLSVVIGFYVMQVNSEFAASRDHIDVSCQGGWTLKHQMALAASQSNLSAYDDSKGITAYHVLNNIFTKEGPILCLIMFILALIHFGIHTHLQTNYNASLRGHQEIVFGADVSGREADDDDKGV